jgi:hypothetical protein
MTPSDRRSTTGLQRAGTPTKVTPVPSSGQKTPKPRSHATRLPEARKRDLEKALVRERARQRAGLDD